MANPRSKINPTTNREPEEIQQRAAENAKASADALAAAGTLAENQAAKDAVQRGSNA